MDWTTNLIKSLHLIFKATLLTWLIRLLGSLVTIYLEENHQPLVIILVAAVSNIVQYPSHRPKIFPGDYCTCGDISRKCFFYSEQQGRNIFHDMNRGGGNHSNRDLLWDCLNLSWRKVGKQDLCMQYCVSSNLRNFWLFFPSVNSQQSSSFPLPEYAAVKPFCIHVSLFLNTLTCDCGTLKQHHIKACLADYSQHMDVLHMNYIFALVWRESKWRVNGTASLPVDAQIKAASIKKNFPWSFMQCCRIMS